MIRKQRQSRRRNDQELETKELGIRADGSDVQTVLVRLEDEFQQVGEVLKAQRREFETVIQ